MFKHVLPEGKVRQKCANVTLKFGCVEVFGVFVRDCLHVV